MSETQAATIVAPAEKKAPIVKPAAQKKVPDQQEANAADEEGEPLLPIADRLEKIWRLNLLISKYELINEALEELKDFRADPAGGDQVIIKTSNGTTHRTNHPDAIDAMVGAAIAKLKTSKQTVEKEIYL